jgi:hypothetical protein
MDAKHIILLFWRFFAIYAATIPSKPLKVPLIITNRCTDTIWPGISTQAGVGPSSHGFELSAGATRNLSVETSWNGRVWGRTNCTNFDNNGTHGSCLTGDCGGNLTCTVTGAASTLAEFNLPAYMNMSFYDISLVDGYNLPLAIQVVNNNSISGMPAPNATNPSCVGSLQGLAPSGFNPYNNSIQDGFLGTSPSNPLPFELDVTPKDITSWCPSDLHMLPQSDRKNQPAFDPCLSACSKTNEAQYCCTGKKNSAKKCGTNYYSRAAKKICPDAYSYAYDDAKSTFAVPTGAGFEIVFCPGGRSTTILKTLGKVSAASLPSVSWGCFYSAIGVVLLFSGLG